MRSLCKQGLPLDIEKRNEAVLESISPLFSAAVALGVAHMPMRTSAEVNAGCTERIADIVEKYNSETPRFTTDDLKCIDTMLLDVKHTAEVIKSLLQESMADLDVWQLTENYEEPLLNVDDFFFM